MTALVVWIFENWIEVAAAVLGMIYLYFSVTQKIWLWPFGLLTSLFYIYVYYVATFYADMSLQVYYVLVSIYGWIHWSKGREGKDELPVQRCTTKVWVWSILAGVFLWGVIYWILIHTRTDVALGDAFTTAFSIVATWMLAQKYIENWILWIVVDGVSLALYVQKGLLATAVLFFVYTTVAVFGFYAWKKTMVLNKSREKGMV
ncbi:MAG TPA: nicotinamide riboside transporter PnuC [Salinivirgaceae bacterium]|nr:nicotinamide riboside transporter PnuC [Salinivirgaceae bacterium]